MDINHYKANLDKITKYRNLLIVYGVVMTISNFMLGINLIFKDKIVVVTPTVINREFELTDKKVSNYYIEDITRDLVNLMLNITPKNTSYIENSILRRVDPKHYGEIKNHLHNLFEDIQKRHISTAFYINNIKVLENGFTAIVQGESSTYFGLQRTNQEDKTYMVKYNYAGGTLHLKEFYELKGEELEKWAK